MNTLIKLRDKWRADRKAGKPFLKFLPHKAPYFKILLEKHTKGELTTEQAMEFMANCFDTRREFWEENLNQSK